MKVYILAGTNDRKRTTFLTEGSAFGDMWTEFDLYHIKIYKTEAGAEKALPKAADSQNPHVRQNGKVLDPHVEKKELEFVNGKWLLNGEEIYHREPIKKSLKEEVYSKCLGVDGFHHCWYCGCSIEMKDMSIDHFLSVKNGGDSEIPNLVPSCRECNNMKFDMTIDEYRNQFAVYKKNLAKDSRYRHLMKHKAIFESHEPVTFWFERNGKGERK